MDQHRIINEAMRRIAATDGRTRLAAGCGMCADREAYSERKLPRGQPSSYQHLLTLVLQTAVWAILGGPSRSFARPLSTHIALGTRALNNTPELRSLYINIGPRIDPTCRWKLAYASKTQCDEITNTVAHTHGFRRVKSLRKETFHATKMVLSGQFTGIVSIVECIKLSLDGFTFAAFSNTACIQDHSFHICPAFKYFQWRIS